MNKSIDLELVFPRHSQGVLAGGDLHAKSPPPVGLLTMAAYIHAKSPGTNIKVLDGNHVSQEWLLENICAPIVGFSVWFTNYEAALFLAQAVKQRAPSTMIVFGGPHATALGELILTNNSFIDAVVMGDGEEVMLGILDSSIECQGIISRPVNMENIPIFDLESLITPYDWSSEGSTAQAFPISSMRGCFRKTRCEYCSLPSILLRTLPADKAWRQIGLLRERYGIDFFFESADTFMPSYARELVKSKEKQSVRFRVYGYPTLLKPDVAALYAELGVTNIFLGIESVLIWRGGFNRSYGRSYSIEKLLKEIELAGEFGIEVMPSFIFGLPGETRETLKENKELVREVMNLSNVQDFHLNPPIPLPGTQYFKSCVESPSITQQYQLRTGKNIVTSDTVDYLSLSHDFINARTSVNSEEVFTAIDELFAEHSANVSHWYRESSESRVFEVAGDKVKKGKLANEGRKCTDSY